MKASSSEARQSQMKRQSLLQKRKPAADLVGSSRKQPGKGKRKGGYFCLKAEAIGSFIVLPGKEKRQ